MSTPEILKSCCAAVYSSDVVALVLGESYHPGGAPLTRKLANLLGLRVGQRVLDVAAGRGAAAGHRVRRHRRRCRPRRPSRLARATGG